MSTPHLSKENPNQPALFEWPPREKPMFTIKWAEVMNDLGATTWQATRAIEGLSIQYTFNDNAWRYFNQYPFHTRANNYSIGGFSVA